MTTIKISQLPSLTGANAATDDVLPLVDTSLNTTNKITREEFFLNTPPISVTGDITIGDKIIHSGDTNTAIRFPANDTVTVETSGLERLRIDSSGNVGIGTSSPVGNAGYGGLSVNGTTGSIFSLMANGTETGRLGAVSGETFLQSMGSGVLKFIRGAGGTESMRIDSSGKLLIGTATSGGSKLRISGLPTSSAGLSAGDVWNDGGTLKIV